MEVSANPIFAEADLFPYQDDFQKIEAFLRNVDAVRFELRRLDATLTNRVRRSGRSPAEELWFELHRMESGNRFSSNLAIVTAALDHPEFMDILCRGCPVKDIGARAMHGEFTHRIQWYLVMQKNIRGGDGNATWLDHSIRDLYTTIGTTTPQRPGERQPANLWEDLFDNLEEDARTPEWLNMHLSGFDIIYIRRISGFSFSTLGTACRSRYRFRTLGRTGAENFIGRAHGDRFQRRIGPDTSEHVMPRGASPPLDWQRWR